jgi:hypothetical protein
MLIQVSPSLRIEDGPARKRAKATNALLDQIQADYRQRMTGSDGKKIVLGQAMEYLDWFGARVWYLYRWDAKAERWLHAHDPLQPFETQEAAIQAAFKLGQEG